jgi:hypothetical protein
MSIRQYILNAERNYDYRIKTVVPLDDDMMGRIERTIMKYQPLKMSAPRKTIFQKAPLDFPNVEGAEVHFVDVTLGLPASVWQMQKELVHFMGLPEKFVAVRGVNDPLETQTEAMNANAELDEKEKEEGAAPGALLNLAHYEEGPETKGEDFYGQTYNRRFLDVLKKVENEKAEARKIDAPNAKFSWLDMPKNDTPEDAGPTIGTEAEKEDEERADQGNMDSDHKTYSRVYQRQGKTYVKRATADGVRKG